MNHQVSDALAALKKIGSVRALEASKPAGAGGGPEGGAGPIKPGNSHIHLPPNFSAFQNIEQVISLARQEHLRYLGASNYYDFAVYGDFARRAQAAGIFPIFGTEIICLLPDLRQQLVKINDPGNPGKMYLCGKSITRFSPLTPGGQAILEEIRQNDSTRMQAMIERLAAYCVRHGIPSGLDEAGVVQMIVRRHGCPRNSVYLQERHVAQALQEALWSRIPTGDRAAKLATLFGAPSKAKGLWDAADAVTVQNEIRTYLMKTNKPGFVEETFIGFAKARRLVLELGGIPCYPILADGTTPICQFEDPVEQLIARIKELGVFATELVPGRNAPEVLTRYAKALRAAGLVVTAGTEHNTLDLVPMTPSCKGGIPIPAELQAIFWEGACVLAAQQFLNVHGQTGYLDAQGILNPAYATDEARIEKLAHLGAAVIAKYTGR